MSAEITEFPGRRTYAARGFSVATDGGEFKLSGTLDGFIDFAVPGGKTHLLSPDEARMLAADLVQAAADVTANCLYERDALLAPDA